MAAAVATAPDLSHSNGGEFISNNGAESNGKKKARESDRRRRRRSKKKNKNNAAGGDDEEASDAVNSSDGAKENADPNENKVEVKVEVEYVPEKADLEGSYLEDFKDVFEKFSFKEVAPTEEDEVKNEEAADSAKKKADSDSEEEQEDQQKKDGGVSNKKKKLERRMKIAELKQVCTRPDVVEVWDATATDPKLLVYLKSYRNTVPVPRHWCQKRKFLQELD